LIFSLPHWQRLRSLLRLHVRRQVGGTSFSAVLRFLHLLYDWMKVAMALFYNDYLRTDFVLTFFLSTFFIPYIYPWSLKIEIFTEPDCSLLSAVVRSSVSDVFLVNLYSL
jgi:hypothetical protein